MFKIVQSIVELHRRHAGKVLCWNSVGSTSFKWNSDSNCLTEVLIPCRGRFPVAQGSIVHPSASWYLSKRVLLPSFATCFQLSLWDMLYSLHWSLHRLCFFTIDLVGVECMLWLHACHEHVLDHIRIVHHFWRKESASHPTLPFLVKGKCRKYQKMYTIDENFNVNSLANYRKVASYYIKDSIAAS